MVERRRKRRFPIQLPVLLKIHENNGKSEIRGISENASETGVLCVTDSSVPLGAEVGVYVTMPNQVRLSAQGKVVRGVLTSSDKFEIAVQCVPGFSEKFPVD